MAFKLAELFVEVAARTGPVDRALAGLRDRLRAFAATRFELPGGGLVGALGIGAGIVAIKAAIAGASDLAETLSKVDQTFGAAGSEVKAFAQSMADAFGLPKREMLDAASNFGLIFTGAGMADGTAADLSVKMAKLAADCSSFYNVPVADALEKIRAGLTGESEPLKAFGVLMNEDLVKARALTLGLAKQGQELSEQAKMQARLSIITEKTGKASGDLERTQAGAANQGRKLWGTLQNLGDTLGTVVLPVFTEFIGLVNEMATDLAAAAADSTGSWGGFLSWLGGAIDDAGVVYRNFGAIIERTGALIGGSLLNAWEYLVYGGSVAAATGDYVGRVLGESFVAVVKMASNLKDNLVEIFTEIWNYVRSGFKDPIEFKLKPIAEGADFKLPEFKMPELKLSDYSNQLQAIDDRMAATEKARDDARLARQKAAAGAGAAGPAAPITDKAKPGAKEKNLVGDSDSYFRELQEAALKSGGDGKDQVVAAVEKGNEIAGTIFQEIKKVAMNTKAPAAAFQ